MEARKGDPFYIMSDTKAKSPANRLDNDMDDVDSIPIVKLTIDDFDPGKDIAIALHVCVL
jgi:hypothetical protein